MKQATIRILDKLRKHPKTAAAFVAVFYAVGVLGLLIPATTLLFIKLIPFALLLSFAILALFHTYPLKRKELIFFTAIFLAGFLVEVAGVNTGIVFGNYRYGDGLGVKLFHTPLLIGLNWLLLVYTTSSMVQNKKFSPLTAILLAVGLMVGYDLVMEQVAPALDMWYWEQNQVPVKNFFAWFLIALIFHLLFQTFGINTKNRLAFAIFICQFIFFLLIYLFIPTSA